MPTSLDFTAQTVIHDDGFPAYWVSGSGKLHRCGTMDTIAGVPLARADMATTDYLVQILDAVVDELEYLQETQRTGARHFITQCKNDANFNIDDEKNNNNNNNNGYGADSTDHAEGMAFNLGLSVAYNLLQYDDSPNKQKAQQTLKQLVETAIDENDDLSDAVGARRKASNMATNGVNPW